MCDLLKMIDIGSRKDIEYTREHFLQLLGRSLRREREIVKWSRPERAYAQDILDEGLHYLPILLFSPSPSP
jgi:hypothetical protein